MQNIHFLGKHIESGVHFVTQFGEFLAKGLTCFFRLFPNDRNQFLVVIQKCLLNGIQLHQKFLMADF